MKIFVKINLILLFILKYHSSKAQNCDDFYYVFDDNIHGKINFHFDSTSIYTLGPNYIYINPNQYFSTSLESSGNGIWQIGAPQKTFGFDESYSLHKAIITDTINPYPVNNLSYFEFKTMWFNKTSFRFRYKLDTDTLKDGFYITLSNDNGVTWTNYLNPLSFNSPSNSGSINHFCVPPLDTLVNGELGISGSSGGWKIIQIEEPFYGVKQMDTIYFRFNFVSDSIETNKMGMMIDDLEFYFLYFPGSVEEYNSLQPILFPNPATTSITINFKQVFDSNQNIYAEIYAINGSFLKRVHLNLQSNDVPIDDLENGAYFINYFFEHNHISTQKLIICRE